MSQLEDLLQQCTVKLTLPNGRGWGTGFFVAPGLILTCAHVVQEVGRSVQVRWQRQENWAQATVKQLLPEPYDLAMLQVMLPADADPPLVYLGAEIYSRDQLYLFGYPDRDFLNGCPAMFNHEGLTGDEPALIKFASGQVRPGMSGSPLLNQRTGKVCGIVKFTLDRSSDLGGGAIPAHVILEQFPELIEQQQLFHQSDQRWGIHLQTLSESNPADLAHEVLQQEKRAENLAKYRTRAIKPILRYEKYKESNSHHPQKINRAALDQYRLDFQISEEEAFEIENDILELHKKFEEEMKARIENHKKCINPTDINDTNSVDINEFTDEVRQELSELQNAIGLGEETVDETEKRIGDEIMSQLYVKIADDLLRQKQLSKAKLFLEEAAKFDKSNPHVYIALASLWSESQKYNKVLVELYKARRLYSQQKSSKDVEKIEKCINDVPISSRIAYLISTGLRRCIVIIQEVI